MRKVFVHIKLVIMLAHPSNHPHVWEKYRKKEGKEKKREEDDDIRFEKSTLILIDI